MSEKSSEPQLDKVTEIQVHHHSVQTLNKGVQS